MIWINPHFLGVEYLPSFPCLPNTGGNDMSDWINIPNNPAHAAGAQRARTIHRSLKTNFILERYDLDDLRKLFH